MEMPTLVYIPPPNVMSTGEASPRRSTAQRNSRPIAWLSFYVKLQCICLFLYAVLGKGFAYAGYKPVFVGEMLLLLGLFTAIKSRKVSILWHSKIGLILTVFAVWELACTIPYVSTYGIDTFRDAMLWAYSSFAWITAAVVMRLPGTIDVVLRRYRTYVGAIVTLGTICFLITMYASEKFPHWPGTEISIPLTKPDDTCVHLGAAVAFLITGLETRPRWWLVPAFLGLGLSGSFTRGGLFSAAAAIGVALLMFPRRSTRLVPIAIGLLIAFALAFVFDLKVSVPKFERQFGARQLLDNAISVVDSKSKVEDTGSLEGTKQWRLDWWNRIWDYTVRGPYFWTGKGFGINLTIDDGVNTGISGTLLRSPHNSNITFLARSGVPGALIWILVQLAWMISMLKACRTAKLQNNQGWARFFGWILAYWLALLVNASFDVSLEGPVCGIAFWTIFGLGWGGAMNFKVKSKRFSQLPHGIS